MSNKDSERPAGPSQPIRRVSTMPAPRGTCLTDDWEYFLQVLAGWEASRDPSDPYFMSGNEGESVSETLGRLLKEGRGNTVSYASGHACPVVYGTMRTSRALIEVYAELALRMPGMHSPLDGLHLASDGECWTLRSLASDTNTLPPFARTWRSGREQFKDACERAGTPDTDRVVVVQPDQVPSIIDWMCMEAQRLDPLLRAIFAEQP